MINSKTIAAAVVGALIVGGTLYLSKIVPEPLQSQPPLGALSSPLLPYDYFGIGGEITYSREVELNTATTTPCAIQSPAATSTLVRTMLRVSTATSTATTWTAATSTDAFSTTSPIVPNFTLASGKLGSMVAATTTQSAGVDGQLAPNTFIVWGVAGTVIAGTTKLNGTCSATFVAI